MDTAKIVISKVQAVSRPQVLPLLRKSVREPRQAPHLHSNREVLALYNRSADALRIGIAHNWDHLRRGDFGRAITAFAFARRAIDLDELSEVYTVPESIANGRSIRSEAVRSYLEALP